MIVRANSEPSRSRSMRNATPSASTRMLGVGRTVSDAVRRVAFPSEPSKKMGVANRAAPRLAYHFENTGVDMLNESPQRLESSLGPSYGTNPIEGAS